MKAFYFLKVLLFLSLSFLSQLSFAQCPAGWFGTATLKWDNRNYLVTTGSYSGFVTAAMSQSQNFAFGTNRVNIAMGGSITTLGQNTVNTGYANSYGSGAAVSYNNNGTITLTFDSLVASLQFSLYSIDLSQTATVTAVDGAGLALNITMTNAGSAPVNTITGSGTTTAKATASNTAVASTSNNGTINISISGFAPVGTNGVKKVTITMGGTGGAFWLSDLSACVYSGFPNNYYIVAKPYTGQPAYILNNSNAPTASMTDVATGKSRYIFKDQPTSNLYLNSFGYDPYKHFLYYSLDGTNTPANNKAVKKYDFNTLGTNTSTMSSGTISTLISDVTLSPFNIPVFDQGLESAGSSFYNGSLYIGVEGSNNAGNTSRYSMIWRIDFDASNNPIKACQVFASMSDDGTSTVLHNWGDFSISNGILYDFNSGDNAGANGVFYHYNLQTGLITGNYPSNNPSPGQSGTAWNENIYWLSGTADEIALYNKNGTIGARSTLSGKAPIDWTSAGSGDGSDAFKPPLDYGDAPASYDPATVDPAVHDYDSTLKLGILWNCEFAKKTTADASGDGATDDGLTGPPVFTNNQTSYSANVNVYNNSGAAATVAGWIDLNNNGVFDPSEGVVVTLSTNSTSLQSVFLSWTGPTIPIGVSYVFMRIRVTSATNGMTVSKPTGYYSNGEVEDYRIAVSVILQTKLVSFGAEPVNNQYVQVNWQVAGEMNMQSYIIERSQDGVNWSGQQSVSPLNMADSTNRYTSNDPHPLPGVSFYRLKMINYSGDYAYSTVAKVSFRNAPLGIAITPNPIKDVLNINVSMAKAGTIVLRLIDSYGKIIHVESINGHQGDNTVNWTALPSLPKGIYIVEATDGTDIVKGKILKE